MAAEETSPAIVLRARDYAEADRIVTLLTRDAGKLSGIAKGAKSSRRRFERKLEPFSHVMLYFRRRPHGDLVFITRAEAGGLAQPAIDDQLAKIALGSYMLELADALTRDGAEAAGAYHLLAAALEVLGQNGAAPALRQAFELKLLGWAGYGLEFNRCRGCGAEPAAHHGTAVFVVARGGVLCARCRGAADAGAISLSAASALALGRLGRIALDGAAEPQACGPDGELAIARFIASIIDRRLRSLQFLESLR